VNRRSLIASLIAIVVIPLTALAATVAAGSTPELGLDLQGGASVVLRPEGDYDSEAIDVAVEQIRSRVDSLGVAEPEVLRQGDTIVVNLPGVRNQERALRIVGRTAELRFRPVLQGLGPDPESVSGTSTTVPGGTTVPGTSTSGPESTTTPSTTAPATTTATTATTAATATTTPGATTTVPAGSTAAPGETTTVPTTSAAPPSTAAGGITPPEDDLPDATVVLPDREDPPNRWLLGPTALTGEGISEADAFFDQQTGAYSVRLNFTGGGSAAFDALAGQCFNQTEQCPSGQLAIVLDGIVQSAPVVQDASYGGEVSITGDFTSSEAEDLATVLRYGRLPVQLEPQAVQTVSATLGKDSLRAGVIAGAIGVGLVILFMLFYYRALAFVVVGGLLISATILYTVIALLSRTSGLALTLAGATGIIVSVGVTVDSYVVFFERMKDDVRAGRTLKGSAERGFKGAWRTIVAADVVSLIGAAVLWWLSVGSVRGFAFFLGLSTLIDLVVSWFFTRPAVILLSRSDRFAGAKVLGVERGEAKAAFAAAGGGS
jgi:preprotein translocase subunit SecD